MKASPVADKGERHNLWQESAPVANETGALDHALAVLHCTACKAVDFVIETGALRCTACDQRYRIEAGIIDGMPTPSPEVVDELRGMMRELGLQGSLDAFTITKVPVISTMEERKALTRDAVFDYYGSTQINLAQALEQLTVTGRETVLEIGGEDDYPFLKPFRDRGCDCYETNVFFRYDDAATEGRWPIRVLGDMHNLPYRDASFDIVLMSAATHHGDLSRLVPELARVTRPGGVVININEPIRGLLKHTFTANAPAQGQQDQSNRDVLVHEHEYSVAEYLRAFRKSGFTVDAWLFSAYYDQRLATGRTEGVRFARLAAAVQNVWHNPIVRWIGTKPGLWVGQILIGLQMNAVFRKRK